MDGVLRCQWREQFSGVVLLADNEKGGFPSAQNNLGIYYKNGVGVEKIKEKALHYYTLAAENNEKTYQKGEIVSSKNNL